jgi:molybdopterin converting factor small subunit
MNKLWLLLIALSCISPLGALEPEVSTATERTFEQPKEEDPIQKLRDAYAQQGKPLEPEHPQLSQESKTTSLVKQALKTYATNFAFDLSGSFLLGYLLSQETRPKVLFKDAFVSAFRIPALLDIFCRIPFRLAQYKERAQDEEEDGWETVRTFAEDLVVDYAVNYTYRTYINQERVKHQKLLTNAGISACRLPLIPDLILRYLFV